MNRSKLMAACVSLLTLGGCSLLEPHLGEGCKSRAYVQVPVADFLKARFDSGAPARVAIIPYSTPANLAGRSYEEEGLGFQLATQLHAYLLKRGTFPIVEVLNRKDWPGKKEEFYTGNFGAIAQAREAGNDLVIVGLIGDMHGRESFDAFTKLIEPESGTTIYYGKSTAFTRREDFNRWDSIWHMGERRTDPSYFGPLLDNLALCVAKEIGRDRETPQ